MDMLVTPKPIFNKHREVEGYYLSFQYGNALIEGGKVSGELNIELPFFDLVNRVGLEVLTYHKMLFVPVTEILLASNLEENCNVDYSMVVLMLNKKISLSESTLKRVIRYKELGFKIAFYSFRVISHLDAFLPYTDYIFCEHSTEVLIPSMRYIKSKSSQARVIAKGIESSKVFDTSVFFGVELLEGQFYKYPVSQQNNQISPLQLNYIQLLNQVKQQNFEFDVFAKVVQRDTALTLQFLKMVNSSITGTKIKSLRHAATMLGQKEIERWITSAATTMMSKDKPTELTRVSLLRAKFCENLAGHFELGVHMDNLFLTGLLSVLDAILEMTMDEALDLVLVPDLVRDALVSHKGEYAPVMDFVVTYEQGNWHEVSRLALINNLSVRQIKEAYFDSLLWYGRLINMTADNK